jgi:diguanylate cyclase (GGDEF)-like protein
MLLIDIDHFKRINDQHGHAAGDAVLVDVARRLRGALRDQDLTVRWGGEEFLIVVEGLPQGEVEALAQRLLLAIGGTPVVLDASGSQRLTVTASIGFAVFPIEPARLPLSWERAIDLVDTAMYLAKAHGRNRAYGVRALHEEEGAAATAQPGRLESAWRDGRADLTHLQGPQAVAP